MPTNSRVHTKASAQQTFLYKFHFSSTSLPLHHPCIFTSIHSSVFKQTFYPSQFPFVARPAAAAARPSASSVRVNTRGSSASDKSFFFFPLPFLKMKNLRRNVLPSSLCENAVCLGPAHLCGPFTPGSHTGTKAPHCFTLCFL